MAAQKRPHGPQIRIVVTRELIEDSKRRDSGHCMIAEAVREAFPTAQRISVDIQTTRFSDPERKLRYTYLTPRRAQQALLLFDQGRTPSEFEFQLRQPQVTLCADNKTRAKRKGGMTPAQAEAVQKNLVAPKKEQASKTRETLKKTSLRNTATSVPTRTGGRTPPTTPFSKRRAFGLRALEF